MQKWLNNDLLCDHQFGIKSGLSTLDALKEFIDSIYISINKNKNFIAIYLYFSKMFDTIFFFLLLEKLSLEIALMIGLDRFYHTGTTSLLLARECRPYMNHVLVFHRGRCLRRSCSLYMLTTCIRPVQAWM